MTVISKLKLVQSKKEQSSNPTITRRVKLVQKLEEQLNIATSQRDGTVFAPKKLKLVIDKLTGERKRVETTKRVKEWYWTNTTGKIHLHVKYGSKTLELAKGRNAIEINTNEELISALVSLKEAVIAGELDEAIKHASEKLKAGFSK